MSQCVNALRRIAPERLHRTFDRQLFRVISRYEAQLTELFRTLPHNDNAPRNEGGSRSITPLDWGAIPLAVIVAACARDVVPSAPPEGTPACGVASFSDARGDDASLHQQSCALDGAYVAMRFTDADGALFELTGTRDGETLRSLRVIAVHRGESIDRNDCAVQFGGSGDEAWGHVHCNAAPPLDADFHACDCTGWTAPARDGSVRARFSHADEVRFASTNARCSSDTRTLHLAIESDDGERFALSGRIGNGSLIDGNLALHAAAIGDVTQNIPVCSASVHLVGDHAEGHVHCEVCGAHGTFDADFETGCAIAR